MWGVSVCRTVCRRVPRIGLATLVLVAELASAVPAGASAQVTTWTGVGTGQGGDRSWLDPANWDNGVPTVGATVTIEPTVFTNITDVPGITLSSLDLTGTGEVPYSLLAADPSSLHYVEITDHMTWRSGRIGEGLGISVWSDALVEVRGSTDTFDRAVLEGQISIEPGGTVRVGTFGTPPTGQSDATLRIGPDTFPAYGGTIRVGADWGSGLQGVLQIDDAAIVVSDQPGFPGSIGVMGGSLQALGPDPAGSSSHVVGARIRHVTTVVGNDGELAAVTFPTAGGGAVPGALHLDGVPLSLMYGNWVAGPGPVVLGPNTAVVTTASTTYLTNDAQLQLGASEAAQPATITGGTIRDWSPGFDGGQIVWENATIGGSGTTFDTTVHVTNGDAPVAPVHEVTADLSLGSLASPVPYESTVEATLTLDPGVLLTVGDATHLTAVDAVAGPATGIAGGLGSAVLIEGTLGFASSGQTLTVDDALLANGGTVALGRSLLALGQGAGFHNLAGATLEASIAGTDPGTQFGAIEGTDLTSGQQVTLAGRVVVTLDGGYVPGFGQGFDVVSVPAGSLSGSFTSGSLPGPTWTSTTDPTSYRLTYEEPAADLKVVGAGPASAPRGRVFEDTLDVGNLGPYAAQNVTLKVRLGRGLRLAWFTVSKGSCSGTAPLVCTFARLSSGASATLILHLRGRSYGGGHVRARARPQLFDPDTTNNAAAVLTQIV